MRWIWWGVLAAGCGSTVGLTGDAPQCSDQLKNGDETGVDCGGSCGKCPAAQGCVHATDCQSGSCTNGKCDAAACDDGMKGGDETDVDCGGATCAKCGVGKSCVSGTDCMTNVCNNNMCKLPKNCASGTKDGDETDVDCGGHCDKCGEGLACTVPADCQKNMCNSGKCQPPPSCSDTTKNGTETDVDCGGSACGKCTDGKTCKLDSDCTSASCSNGVCCGKNLGNCDGATSNGCETKLDTDPKNCGKCGTACVAPKPSCAMGACQACGTDCFGPAGCLTKQGRCITLTCRPWDAPPSFCQSCKGLKEVTYDQWLNGGYCGDVAAKFREVAGYTAMCSGPNGNDNTKACCGSTATCTGFDNVTVPFGA